MTYACPRTSEVNKGMSATNNELIRAMSRKDNSASSSKMMPRPSMAIVLISLSS